MKIPESVKERTKELITEGLANCMRKPRVNRELEETTEATIAYTLFSVGMPMAGEVIYAGADAAFKAMEEDPTANRWGDGLVWVGRRLGHEGKPDGIRIMLDALAKFPRDVDDVIRELNIELEEAERNKQPVAVKKPFRWGDGLIWAASQLAKGGHGELDCIDMILKELAEHPGRGGSEVQRVIAKLTELKGEV